MIVLGIDQSMTCTGLVIFNDGSMVYHGVIKTSKDEGTNFVRYNIITNRILNLIQEWDIDIVNIEGLPMGRSIGNSHKTLAGLQAVIVSNILKEYNKECGIIAPTAVKKYATGSGKAKKEDMLEAVPEYDRNKFIASGYKKTTGIYDLSDAYFIGLYML